MSDLVSISASYLIVDPSGCNNSIVVFSFCFRSAADSTFVERDADYFGVVLNCFCRFDIMQ